MKSPNDYTEADFLEWIYTSGRVRVPYSFSNTRNCAISQFMKDKLGWRYKGCTFDYFVVRGFILTKAIGMNPSWIRISHAAYTEKTFGDLHRVLMERI